MEAIAFYLLMLQKDIYSKQNLVFRNISGDFLLKKKGLNGCVYDFSVYDKNFDIQNVYL